MKHKNKSIRIVKLPLIGCLTRRTTINIDSARVYEELSIIANVSQLIEDIIKDVFKSVNHINSVIDAYQRLNQQFQTTTLEIQSWQNLQAEEIVTSVCESEPEMATHIIGKLQKINMIKNRQNNRISGFLSIRSIKEQTKSCDFDLTVESKCIQKHLAKKEEIKLKCNNSLLPLLELNRKSEDHSEEIQELLRRKKQLQLVRLVQRQQRLNTQLSKRSLTERKKNYFQSDDGHAMQMSCNNKKGESNKFLVGDIKYLPGQTLYEGIKKKTIMEHMFVKRKKKRRDDRNLGDTCVLIEQIRESEPLFDLSSRQFSTMLRKGVKVKILDSLEESRQLKFPLIR